MRLGSPHGGKMARQTVLLIKMKRVGKDERSYRKLSKGIEIHTVITQQPLQCVITENPGIHTA